MSDESSIKREGRGRSTLRLLRPPRARAEGRGGFGRASYAVELESDVQHGENRDDSADVLRVSRRLRRGEPRSARLATGAIGQGPTRPTCRFCSASLEQTFVDLGMQPTGQRYVAVEALDQPEIFYPLHAWVCHVCFLVQLEEVVPRVELFADGAHTSFSSDSSFWVRHACRFVDEVIERFSIDESRFVVEVGSNDGYLLKNFAARGIPSLGIEPAANVARAARENGVETIDRFCL